MLLHLCERFGQPLSVILKEDAALLRMIHIEHIEKARIARDREEADDY